MRRLLAPLLLLLCPSLSQAEDVIQVWNWNDYIAPQVLKDFEKDTGIRVEYRTFSTAEELDQALQSDAAIDIAVPSHDTLPTLIKAGRLQPLDLSLLPNRKHLDKAILSKLAAFDPQNRYAVPYLWGTVGLAVNVPQAEAALGGPVPNSWNLLFDPAMSGKLASCGMAMIDSSSEALAVLLNYQGRNLAHSSPKQLKRAGDTLASLRPNLRYIDSERYIADLANGKLCVAFAWVGDALAAADAGQPVRFMVPEEGSALFIDNMVIPTSSKRADLAHRFINYLLQPQVAALTSSEVLYPNPNKDASQFMDDNLQQQLAQVNTAKRRLFAPEALPDKLEVAKEEVWSQFKGKP